MIIQSHKINNIEIAEVVSNKILIENPDDVLDLIGNLYYQGFDKFVMYEKILLQIFSI